MTEFVILTKAEAETLRGAPYKDVEVNYLPPVATSVFSALDPRALKDGTYLINVDALEAPENAARAAKVAGIKSKSKVDRAAIDALLPSDSDVGK